MTSANDEFRKQATQAAQQATGRIWCSHGAHYTAPVGRWIESRVRRFICTGCQKLYTELKRKSHAAVTLTPLQGKRVNAARGGRAESHPSDYQRPVGSPDARRAIEDRREQQEAEAWNYGI